MRVMYGVQGTGNGHTTRARTLLPALKRVGIEVDFLFSGRDPDLYFNMEPFGDYQVRQGVTLKTEAGRVKLGKTAIGNNLIRLVRDIRGLDLEPYDLVISDFEPVTAWAAKLQHKPSVGIAHQYAFLHHVPGSRRAPWLKFAMKAIAPVDQAIGIHWHPFGAPILPPLIEPEITRDLERLPQQSHVLVYLPFECLDEIRYWFSNIEGHHFVAYAAVAEEQQQGSLTLKPFSRAGFCHDLAAARGVICNAGFGVCSEAIQSGKKLLVKPLANQIEQRANADALESMGRAQVMNKISLDTIQNWLNEPERESPQPWPDTAGALAGWIQDGRSQPLAELADELWEGFPTAQLSHSTA